MTQLAFDLFPDRKPGECPSESKTVELGGLKSYCEDWGRWTNCREVNHCTMEGTNGSDDAMARRVLGVL